jgi:hypothetical protein
VGAAAGHRRSGRGPPRAARARPAPIRDPPADAGAAPAPGGLAALASTARPRHGHGRGGPVLDASLVPGATTAARGAGPGTGARYPARGGHDAGWLDGERLPSARPGLPWRRCGPPGLGRGATAHGGAGRDPWHAGVPSGGLGMAPSTRAQPRYTARGPRHARACDTRHDRLGFGGAEPRRVGREARRPDQGRMPAALWARAQPPAACAGVWPSSTGVRLLRREGTQPRPSMAPARHQSRTRKIKQWYHSSARMLTKLSFYMFLFARMLTNHVFNSCLFVSMVVIAAFSRSMESLITC